MKYLSAFMVPIIMGSAMLSYLPAAQASSIQIMEPSTSKIQVIGTKKKTSAKPLAKNSVKKMVPSSKPEIQAQPVAAKPTMPGKPVMPKMRRGEAELPVVQVNDTKNK
jgi:hypothetical protein